MLRSKTVEGKKSGRTYYKEVIVEGRDKYQRRNSEGGLDEFVAQMVEVVPVHTPCFRCQKFIGNDEADMAEYMIHDECNVCKKVQMVNKLDKKDIEVKCTHRKQTFVCFECFEELCNDY